MPKYLKVENGEVVGCVENVPETEIGLWVEAVEVVPNIVENRQIIEGHYFNINSNPPEIVYTIKNLSLEERKESAIMYLNAKYHEMIREELIKEFNGIMSNTNIVLHHIVEYRSKRNQIENSLDHEQLDLVLSL